MSPQFGTLGHRVYMPPEEELAHLRRQRDELQTYNTAILERARAAEALVEQQTSLFGEVSARMMKLAEDAVAIGEVARNLQETRQTIAEEKKRSRPTIAELEAILAGSDEPVLPLLQEREQQQIERLLYLLLSEPSP